MNKRYIDFVPAKAAQTVSVKKTAVTPKKQPISASKKEVDELQLSEMFAARSEKPRAGVTMTGKKKAPSTAFKVPRVRFVNTEKITKRPLSKNVYQKKIIIPDEPEVPSKPITIIDKPEKDSKMGMIAAIIITIILGAAAGTVAFLLLPS